MSEIREWIVRGRVQRVAFRASARRRALELGLRGLAENLADGCVRVIGVGDADALDRFADWLGDGPPAARVSGLTLVSDAERTAVEADFEGFTTR